VGVSYRGSGRRSNSTSIHVPINLLFDVERARDFAWYVAPRAEEIPLFLFREKANQGKKMLYTGYLKIDRNEIAA
jgi:hypothetical protein